VNRKVENHGKIWRPVGCKFCNNTGYHGQIGLFEGIIIDSSIEALFDSNPSDRLIKQTARAQGILDIREDGVLKVLNAITTLEDMYRVADMTGER
jgi:type IV pilus assembly protein PilB